VLAAAGGKKALMWGRPGKEKERKKSRERKKERFVEF